MASVFYCLVFCGTPTIIPGFDMTKRKERLQNKMGPRSAWSGNWAPVPFLSWALLWKRAREEMEGHWWEIPGNWDPPTPAGDSGELQALGIENTSESQGSRRQIAQTINKWENSSESVD